MTTTQTYPRGFRAPRSTRTVRQRQRVLEWCRRPVRMPSGVSIVWEPGTAAPVAFGSLASILRALDTGAIVVDTASPAGMGRGTLGYTLPEWPDSPVVVVVATADGVQPDWSDPALRWASAQSVGWAPKRGGAGVGQ